MISEHQRFLDSMKKFEEAMDNYKDMANYACKVFKGCTKECERVKREIKIKRS